jgi:hypothetical protein
MKLEAENRVDKARPLCSVTLSLEKQTGCKLNRGVAQQSNMLWALTPSLHHKIPVI